MKTAHLACVRQVARKVQEGLLNNSSRTAATETEDAGVQAGSSSSEKDRTAEYEKNIAEMKIRVYEMKESMSELEKVYTTDIDKRAKETARLESELKVVRGKLAEAQEEARRLTVRTQARDGIGCGTERADREAKPREAERPSQDHYQGPGEAY